MWGGWTLRKSHMYLLHYVYDENPRISLIFFPLFLLNYVLLESLSKRNDMCGCNSMKRYIKKEENKNKKACIDYLIMKEHWPRSSWLSNIKTNRLVHVFTSIFNQSSVYFTFHLLWNHDSFQALSMLLGSSKYQGKGISWQQLTWDFSLWINSAFSISNCLTKPLSSTTILFKSLISESFSLHSSSSSSNMHLRKNREHVRNKAFKHWRQYNGEREIYYKLWKENLET